MQNDNVLWTEIILEKASIQQAVFSMGITATPFVFGTVPFAGEEFGAKQLQHLHCGLYI